MLIKYKLLSNTGVFLLTLILILVIFKLSNNTVKQLYYTQYLAHGQSINMLSLRRHEKDFLARKDLSYQEQFQATFKELSDSQVELIKLSQQLDLPTNTLLELNDVFDSYQDRFNAVVSAHVELGLTPNTGLTGELRAAVHGIEEEFYAHNEEVLLVHMLQLRRAEKDFMLRSDLKYVERFTLLIEQLKEDIRAKKFSGDTQKKLLGLTEEYEKGFMNYAKGAQKIGLSSKQGMLLLMRKDIQSTEEGLESLVETLDAEIEKRLMNNEYFVWSVSFAIGLLSVVLTLLINRSIIRPLNTIRLSMMNMHKTQNITSRLTSDNNDEIKQVADSINILLDDVQLALTKVWDAADYVGSSAKQLSSASSASLKSVKQQSEETVQVSASMIEMVGAIKEITSGMEKVSSVSSTAKENAQSAQHKVDSSIAGIVRLSERLEGAVGTVEALEKEGESIGSVLNVIQGIAEQTNLLALNAAIEAARAGEQGRGFAVVADEVRALASRTHDATIEISDMIDSLQKRTKSIVKLVSDCREDGTNSRSDAELIKTILDEIIVSVMDIADMSKRISLSLGAQAMATNEVSGSLERIRETSEYTASVLDENDQLSKDIVTQSITLNTALSASKK